MNVSHCEKEQAILAAAQSGRWEDELHAHAAACPVCADVVLVAQFMQNLAEEAGAEAALPDAGRIWWKAQLLAKQAAVERATLPIAIVEKIAYACAALALAAGVVWTWPLMSNWLAQVRTAWTLVFSASTFSPHLLLLTSAGLFLFLLLSLLYTVWAEQ